MLEWIISSSVLIVVVILLRFVLKGKISLRLQYALWALVLVRLLLPVSFGSSSISIMNQLEKSQVYQDVIEPEFSRPEVNIPEAVVPGPSAGVNTNPSAPNTETPPVTPPDTDSGGGNTGSTQQPEQSVPVPPETPVDEAENSVDWLAVLRCVWLGGSVVLGAWLLLTNLLFAAKLRKSRSLIQTKYKLPVYVCNSVDTPCLFGFFRPAVYLTSDVASDGHTMRHALEHEITHYRHGDHIWAILRCVCLAVHWFNPLVWWAAILSKYDAELACDESTIRRLGESERAEYGRTLLRLTCEKRTAVLTTATTMTGNNKTIKERIALIVKKPKMAVYTLVAVLLIAAIAIVCTFTGAKDTENAIDDPADNITEDNGTEDDGNSDDSGGSEDNGEIEIPEEIAYLLNLLETLTVEDVTGYSANMQADTETIVPLVNAVAATYAGEYEMDYEWEWHVDLHLAERNDDSGYSPELVGFHIGLSEGIVDVSCRLNANTDPSDYLYIRLYSEELWDYIFSLYNPDGIDQHALSLYEDILAEHAQWRIEEHQTYNVPQGFPELTGFEITSLRLVDSFHYGYSFRVYRFDIGYLTDDPDPGQYGWPQDAGPDEQGRICGYDWSIYFVAAHAHDDLVDYRFFSDSIAYWLPLNFHMDIVASFTGEQFYLDYQRAEDGNSIYTHNGISISIPYNFENLVEAHKDSDTWCYGLVMNPTYYFENPYLTDQALFNLFHICEYSADGSGLIFSIRRYTEEEYQTMYLNSYSRQQVFARDENYYYCAFIPSRTSDEEPERAAIIAAILDQQLEKILADMVERNGWQAYAGGEKNNPQFSDMSVIPTNYQMIFTERVQDVMNRHNAVCEERNQCAFTGYQVLTFDLKDTFTRDGVEYLIYHWEVAFLTNDPDADQSQWAGSAFVDDRNRIHYYETDTFFVVCREKDHFKWDFFHYDLYSDPQDVVFDLLVEHFAALEMRDQEIYIAAHNRLSNLTAEDIKAVFDEDSNRLDAPELAAKISAAMEHHIVWPTGAVFPWNVRVYLSGGPDSYNPNTDEYMTLSVYERENIVNIWYGSEDGEHITLVCEDEALYWYIRRLCGGESVSIRDASVVPEEYREIISARAEETVVQHNAVCEEREQPSFIGYEVLSFEFVDSFSRNGGEYLIYKWDVVFPTNDPNADNGMWAGSPFADDQYRIHLYEQYTNFVVYKKDGQAEYGFFHNQLFADFENRAYAQIVQHFTAEEFDLTGTRVENGTIYTREGISILIPDGWCSMSYPSRHTEYSGGDCCATLVNPTYYSDLTDQTLFSLYHANEYWMDGLGCIFSIQRYTEDEYGSLNLDSIRVFAKDDAYYYGVLIPADAQFEYTYMDTVRDRVLDSVLVDMIERNGWEPYDG